MNACLARLGIRPEIQDWLLPYYYTDETGNPCFTYGDDTEVYGLAFHRVPLTSGCWIAGPDNFTLVRQVIICSSAMEAIAWLNCNFTAFRTISNLLFVATGSNLADGKLNTLRDSLPGRKYILLFGDDLVGRVCDLKAAALLAGHPAGISMANETVQVTFRNRRFYIPSETFSLNAFERLSGYRFHSKTSKPGQHGTWLSQLLNY